MVLAADRQLRPRLRGVAAGTAVVAASAAVAAALPGWHAASPFPLGDDDAARLGGAALGTALLAASAALPRRGLLAWLVASAILAWAVAGHAVLREGLAVWRALPASLALAALLTNRQALTARSPFAHDARREAAAIFVVSAAVAGLVAARAAGAHFAPPIATWSDAAWWMAVTVSTVGYGDVVPHDLVGRAVAIGVIATSVASLALGAGVLLPPLLHTTFRGVQGAVQRASRRLADHVVVAGESPSAHVLVRELQRREVELVLVTRDPAFLRSFERVDFPVVEGDAAHDATLERAGVRRARALVACAGDDAANAFVVLAARDLAPHLSIVAMASEEENVAKLRLAGADVVVSPPVVGGALLARAALGERRAADALGEAGAGASPS